MADSPPSIRASIRSRASTPSDLISAPRPSMATTTSTTIQALLARPQEFVKASTQIPVPSSTAFSFIPRQLRKQPSAPQTVLSQIVRATTTDTAHSTESVSSQQISEGSTDGTTMGSSGESSRNSTPPTPYSPIDPETVLKESTLLVTEPPRTGTPISADVRQNVTPPTSPNKRRASVELSAARSPRRIKGSEGMRLDKPVIKKTDKFEQRDEPADTSMDLDSDVPGRTHLPVGKRRMHGPLPYEVIMANGGGFEYFSDEEMPDAFDFPEEEPKLVEEQLACSKEELKSVEEKPKKPLKEKSAKEKSSVEPAVSSPPSSPSKRKLEDGNEKPTAQRRKSNDGSATPSPSKTTETSASSENKRTELKEWRENRKKLRAKGFENPHSLCYRNSALQFILANDHLFWLLRGHERDCKVKGDCPACQLISLHKHHFGEAKKRMNKNPYTPRFVQAVRKQLPKLFHGAQQQDSAEYMRVLLDKVEEALKKGKPKEDENRHPLRQNLGGDLRSSITCPRCKNVSDTPLDSLDLIITPGDWIKANDKSPFDIEKALDKHFSPETVEWTCDKCKKKSDCKKRLRYVRPPRFLTIPIARHTTRIGRHGMPIFGKLGNQVRYGPTLEVLAEDGKQKSIFHYKLASVVGHLGSLSGGHYVAFAIQPDGTWALCDDDDIRTVSLKTVTSCDGNCYQAAILGYSFVKREVIKGDSSKL